MTEGFQDFGQSKPFERRHLKSQDSRDFVNVPMDEEEQAMLRDLKELFHCDKEATVIKKCIAWVHGNVAQSQSTKAFYSWLSEARRVRPGTK